MAQTDLQPSAAPTVAEVEQKLAQLQAERAGLAALLNTIPQREAEALEKDAPDSTFQKIDLDRRRAHHKLQRLNTRHHELQGILDEARAAEAQVAWSGFVDRYGVIAEEVRALGRDLSTRYAELFDLVNESQRAGFSTYACGTGLPYPPQLYHRAITDNVGGTVPALRAVRFGKRPGRTYTVRFLEWTAFGETAYLMGQEAGFPAEEAWRLVIAQRAEWVDQTNIPPRPASQRRHKAPKIPLVEPRIRSR